MSDRTAMARPLSALADHYTAIVVGSGYGGAIMASRLARAGQAVALLERGRELHPGDFPRTMHEAKGQLQVIDGRVQIGDRRNLYHFTVGPDMNVFAGCGLGGTSLINANVALRPVDAVLDDGRWPAALRNDRAGLDEGYRRAGDMLRPETYPAAFPPLHKVAALRASAAGDQFALTPINVTFRTGPNHVGVHQEACNGCGDCVTGCNYGAKNTLAMNYLPDAANHGAEIYTEVDVRSVERTGDVWTVWYQPLGLGRGRFDAPPLGVSADIVVVSAGTMGSNEILLRSRLAGLTTSDRLGERFTGNGDMLGYSYGLANEVDGIGAGPARPSATAPAGPCITSVIDDRGQPDPLDDIIIEDAAIPGALAPLVPGMLLPQLLPDWLHGRLPGFMRGLLESVLSRGRRGPLTRLQTFLLMGVDDDEGRVVLDDDRPRVEWPDCGTRPFYARAETRLGRAAKASGGRFLASPIYDRFFHNRVVTVHPLGGCVMADRSEDGVVDDRGRVFAGPAGTDVHPGLYVADGSVVPVPLGVNPLLTISALTERTAAMMAADHGWALDVSIAEPAPSDAVPADAASALARRGAPVAAAGPGLRFTEKMGGWCALGDGGITSTTMTDLDVYRAAAQAGEAAASALTFVLTLSTDDAHAAIAHLDAPFHAMGTVVAPALSPEPMTVRGGQFQLFVADDADPGLRHMWYRLPLEATDGKRYSFVGFKVVQAGNGVDAWADTTTLYVTLRADDEHGPVIGRGVLRIAPADFVRQVGTMTTTGPVGHLERLELLARFGEHFAGLMVHDYGHVVARTSLLSRHAPPRPHRPLRVPPPSIHTYRSLDGLDLRLTRYKGGRRGPVVVSHGQGANPLTFSTDTIEVNCVEYLVANGFDVWVQEWRASTLLPTCHGDFDADQVARLDHPATESYVRRATGRHDLHWVTHCVGSATVTMSALAGTVTPASLLASSVAMHPIGPTIMKLKVDVNAAGWLRRLGVRHMTTDAYDDESLGAKALDQLLRWYPIPKAERCDQAVCRRLAFIYGNAIHHAAVDQGTHLALHELFGTTSIRMMVHLARCAGAGKLVDATGGDVYLPRLDLLQFPLTLFHGEHNLVWVPESTKRSYELLVGEFGPANYRRVVFPAHGHQDTFMGERSVDDVFPEVLAHLERAGA